MGSKMATCVLSACVQDRKCIVCEMGEMPHTEVTPLMSAMGLEILLQRKNHQGVA